MARNANVTKMKRQRFRKHRGAYASRSDASTLDPGFNNPALQKFWAERVATPSSVDRARIPEKYRGYVDYRGHSKPRGYQDIDRFDRENDGNTPFAYFWLNRFFPECKFISDERAQAAKLAHIITHKTSPELHFVMWRTKLSILRLYFTPMKDCWWFVLQERFTLKASITYGSKQRAQAVCSSDSIRWKAAQVFVPDSS